jgi:hypothetical protein
MHRRLWIFAAALLMGFASGGVAAQDASPAADDFVTPDPAACQVAPRSVDELVAFLATPAAGTPAAETAAPAGEPADADTVAAVTDTVNELYACYNANAFLRVYGLYTDGFLARSLAGADINPDALSLFATPIAPEDPADRISVAVRDVQMLPDGRVSVRVVDRTPLANNAENTTIYLFVERDGRWLIDDMILNPAG